MHASITFVCLLASWFVRSLVHWLVRSLSGWLVRSFVCLFVRSVHMEEQLTFNTIISHFLYVLCVHFVMWTTAQRAYF